MLLLHGGAQTRRSWDRTADALIAAGYRVVRYDARGHGDSDWAPDGDYSLDAFRDDLLTIYSHVTSGPLAIVGASIGGIVALHAVATAELSIRALVIADIVLRPAREGDAGILRLAELSETGFANVEAAAAALSTAFPDETRANPAGLSRQLRLLDGRWWWRWDPRLLGAPDRLRLPDFAPAEAAVAAGVACPVLLLRGARSPVVDDAGVDHLQSFIPGLCVEVIEDAGHQIARDQGRVFADRVRRFLQHHLPIMTGAYGRLSARAIGATS
ncbi:alpha/beta fold hydrolase [Sphingomonas sp. CROZ-RG-20F-R02-07]|uniref:alpha/beta fold hydrolase n=1 Tax=Sphingomonas sp. CROZ-RG-20F-R02-07 TaxID=2914832 RepID=UPI001F55E054